MCKDRFATFCAEGRPVIEAVACPEELSHTSQTAFENIFSTSEAAILKDKKRGRSIEPHNPEPEQPNTSEFDSLRRRKREK
jgi:hypothetical protein